MHMLLGAPFASSRREAGRRREQQKHAHQLTRISFGDSPLYGVIQSYLLQTPQSVIQLRHFIVTHFTIPKSQGIQDKGLGFTGLGFRVCNEIEDGSIVFHPKIFEVPAASASLELGSTF